MSCQQAGLPQPAGSSKSTLEKLVRVNNEQLPSEIAISIMRVYLGSLSHLYLSLQDGAFKGKLDAQKSFTDNFGRKFLSLSQLLVLRSYMSA